MVGVEELGNPMFFIITTLPWEEEEADPQDEERGAVAVPVPEATRGRGSGEVGDTSAKPD